MFSWARNGYEVLKGERLRSLKGSIQALDVPETDFGNISKTPQLGVFDFRAFLNLAMLVSESDRAKLLRQVILDVVITIRLPLPTLKATCPQQPVVKPHLTRIQQYQN